MKILVSAFACLPGKGSEGGVGWFWSLEWAKDHDVVVITDVTRRHVIEAELLRQPRVNPRIIYFRPAWLRWMPLNSWTAQVLFQLWQLGAVSFVRRLHAEEGFDLMHHVTYGVFRQPSLLGRVGVPLVFGPVGGGEDAPWRLKRSMPFRNKIREASRAALNAWARVDPWLRFGLKHSALILAKTGATARALPSGFESKTRVALEIGTVVRAGVVPRSLVPLRPVRLMYAGSLYALKGLHLGLRAMAAAIERGADLRLTLIGDGPMARPLRDLAARLQILDRIEWIDRLPQTELFARYSDFDVLLFPSLRDSSGNVVMEALSYALPVICFDLGGPADIVDERCGRVVATSGRDELACVEAMADAVVEVSKDGDLYKALSAGALARSAELDFEQQAARIKRWSLQCVQGLPPAESGEKGRASVPNSMRT